MLQINLTKFIVISYILKDSKICLKNQIIERSEQVM